LPKDLQRLVLSFYDPKTKSQLIAVSHFTSNYIAKNKSPDLMQRLHKKQTPAQQWVDHVLECFRKMESLWVHRMIFMLATSGDFNDYGTEEKGDAFEQTL